MGLIYKQEWVKLLKFYKGLLVELILNFKKKNK
jgi:hypothetical protein